jgi:hypothetical protein
VSARVREREENKRRKTQIREESRRRRRPTKRKKTRQSERKKRKRKRTHHLVRQDAVDARVVQVDEPVEPLHLVLAQGAARQARRLHLQPVARALAAVVLVAQQLRVLVVLVVRVAALLLAAGGALLLAARGAGRAAAAGARGAGRAAAARVGVRAGRKVLEQLGLTREEGEPVAVAARRRAARGGGRLLLGLHLLQQLGLARRLLFEALLLGEGHGLLCFLF